MPLIKSHQDNLPTSNREPNCCCVFSVKQCEMHQSNISTRKYFVQPNPKNPIKLLSISDNCKRYTTISNFYCKMSTNNPPEMSNWNAISTSLLSLLANTMISLDMISIGSARLPQTRLVVMLISSINNSTLLLQQPDGGIYNQKQLQDTLYSVKKEFYYVVK